jgi:hypothetical protein
VNISVCGIGDLLEHSLSGIAAPRARKMKREPVKMERSILKEGEGFCEGIS